MPIRPENKKRYPANWKMIRALVLERAGHRCEWCGKPNHTDVTVFDELGLWHTPADGFRCVTDGASEDPGYAILRSDRRTVRVVLTVAHLDHQPENNTLENLRALCQRCHNRYDQEHRMATRRATLAARKAQ